MTSTPSSDGDGSAGDGRGAGRDVDTAAVAGADAVGVADPVAGQALAGLVEGLDALASRELWRVPDADLGVLVQQTEVVRRRLNRPGVSGESFRWKDLFMSRPVGPPPHQLDRHHRHHRHHRHPWPTTSRRQRQPRPEHAATPDRPLPRPTHPPLATPTTSGSRQ